MGGANFLAIDVRQSCITLVADTCEHACACTAKPVLASMELRHAGSPTNERSMTEKSRSLSSGALAAFAFGAIALSGCAARAPGLPAGIEQQLEHATSALDHGTIASEYERQAALDEATATRHLGYAAIYRRNRTPRSGVQAHETLAQHCESLAHTYKQAANQNRVMANLHRKLAGAPG